MKNFTLTIAIIGAIILSSSFTANATNFRCGLSITDTCNGGGYSGTYDVIVEVYYNGGLVSTGTGTANSPQSCVLLTCDLKSQSSLQLYQLKLTKVYRTGGSCGLTTSVLSGYLYWADIATCNANTPVFSVTF